MNDTIQYYEGYKTYRGFKYHLNFPDEWILDEKENTGRDCCNCVGTCPEDHGYAMWRGIILGYCANCAEDYNGERGCGFLEFGVENANCDAFSAFDTYLEGVKLDEIGDVLAYPEDTLENHFEFKRYLNNVENEVDVEDLHFCSYCKVSASGEVTCSIDAESEYGDYDDSGYPENDDDDGDDLPLINGEYIVLKTGEAISINHLQYRHPVLIPKKFVPKQK